MDVIITGASRGIGLELTKAFLNSGHEVLALARHPDKSELGQLKKKYENLTLGQLDLLDEEAHKKIVELTSKRESIDLLINNAGINEGDENIDQFQKSFLVNTIQPLFLTRALFPKLKKAKLPKVAFISSAMGSIGENSGGGYYSYRSSKAALNMLVKSLVIDAPWLISLILHPGWVKTDMGGPEAPVLPEDSARGLFEVIQKAEIQQSGSFQDYQGKPHSW